MIDIENDANAAPTFQAAVEGLRQASQRSELELVQIAAPAQTAKHAIAFAASISLGSSSDSGDRGTGRFVLLHETEPQEQWGGNFRVVCFAKSPLETEIGADEVISDISWAWLNEALAQRDAEFTLASATVTRVISTGYGALEDQSDHAELEMRASWSPTGSNFVSHIEAWQDLICMMSGYPTLPQGVSHIETKRQR
jgi:hypothetical protein